MKKHVFETTTKIVFLILFVVVVILISLGIQQDFAKLKTTEFWVEILVKYAVTIVIFNVVYSIDIDNRKHDKLSRFFKAYATNIMRIKEIEDKKLYDQLDKAVADKNKEILVKKCNSLLHCLCTRVNYDDVITGEQIEYIINKYRVAKKRQKKFTKLVMKIREGRIKIKPIKAEIFLQDKEVLFSRGDVYDYSNLSYEIKRNSIKSTTFLICSIITATISFSFVAPNFWTALLTNFTLFLGATVSGFVDSSKSIKLKM